MNEGGCKLCCQCGEIASFISPEGGMAIMYATRRATQVRWAGLFFMLGMWREKNKHPLSAARATRQAS